MGKKRNWGFLIITPLIFSLFACNSNKPIESTIPKDLNINNDVFPQDSFNYYEKALSEDSLNIDLRIALATNYYAKKQFDKAIDHLLLVHRFDNKNIEAIITLGNIYYDSEQNEKAIEYYEKALVFDKENVNVRCDLATCYLNLKNPEKARILLKKNIEINYNHAQSHHNLSVVYSQLGKTKEAEDEMKIFNSLNK
jgi:tetratricopeptide (TPR) repeat protein